MIWFILGAVLIIAIVALSRRRRGHGVDDAALRLARRKSEGDAALKRGRPDGVGPGSAGGGSF